MRHGLVQAGERFTCGNNWIRMDFKIDRYSSIQENRPVALLEVANRLIFREFSDGRGLSKI